MRLEDRQGLPLGARVYLLAKGPVACSDRPFFVIGQRFDSTCTCLVRQVNPWLIW